MQNVDPCPICLEAIAMPFVACPNGHKFHDHCAMRITACAICRSNMVTGHIRVQFHISSGAEEVVVDLATTEIGAYLLAARAKSLFGIPDNFEVHIAHPRSDPIPAGTTAILAPTLGPLQHEAVVNLDHDTFCAGLLSRGFPSASGLREVKYVIPESYQQLAWGASMYVKVSTVPVNRAWVAREIPEGTLLMIDTSACGTEEPVEPCASGAELSASGAEPHANIPKLPIRMVHLRAGGNAHKKVSHPQLMLGVFVRNGPTTNSRYVWLAADKSVWSVPRALDDLGMRADLFTAEFAEYKYHGLAWREYPGGYEVFVSWSPRT